MCILLLLLLYVQYIIHYDIAYRYRGRSGRLYVIILCQCFFFFSNGIVHLRTAPATAENAVKTTKHALSAALADCKNKNLPKSMILNKFLLGYRNILLRGKHHQY